MTVFISCENTIDENVVKKINKKDFIFFNSKKYSLLELRSVTLLLRKSKRLVSNCVRLWLILLA